MWKILKYSIYDLQRSKWTYAYLLFFLLLTLSLLFLSNDLSKVIVSLMNVILVLCPLIATIFGVMYYYNSSNFIELLLAQPIKRTSIFKGLFLGLAISLSLSLALGVLIPFLFYGLFVSGQVFNFVLLIVVGVLLTFIFSAFAFFIALLNDNRIKGFGISILVWLLFAVVYDGIFLLLLLFMNEYPLEKLAIGVSMANPIDLSRILILMKLDISALMGYTGAVFKKFFGTGLGMAFSFSTLIIWVALPYWMITRVAKRKDF